MNNHYNSQNSIMEPRRLRLYNMRKTVDYNSSIINELRARIYQRNYRDRPTLQPHAIYKPQLMTPHSYIDNISYGITAKSVKTCLNTTAYPIFVTSFTPNGQRVITGSFSGEFTLWNSLTFNFETILNAHDSQIRAMRWSHNSKFMMSADNLGIVKYWQSNMNCIRLFHAHPEPVRMLSFSPSDEKFVSASDDGTLRVWDFDQYSYEYVYRGHRAEVKCVDWHPQKSLIASGSKDHNVHLWDARSRCTMQILHAHKGCIADVKWNENGNWLATASFDQSAKLFDIRKLDTPLHYFRGHKSIVSCLAWHPVFESLLCTSGYNGSIMFWGVGNDAELECVVEAHEGYIFSLSWHPLGHILCSGGNDRKLKFWDRNHPGDTIIDFFHKKPHQSEMLTHVQEKQKEDVQKIPLILDDTTESDGLLNESQPSVIIEHKRFQQAKSIPNSFQNEWYGNENVNSSFPKEEEIMHTESFVNGMNNSARRPLSEFNIHIPPPMPFYNDCGPSYFTNSLAEMDHIQMRNDSLYSAPLQYDPPKSNTVAMPQTANVTEPLPVDVQRPPSLLSLNLEENDTERNVCLNFTTLQIDRFTALPIIYNNICEKSYCTEEYRLKMEALSQQMETSS